MRKRLLIAFAAGALAIAACHSGSTTPTPSATPPTPTPNPKDTKATVLVTVNGTPAPHIPVEESTPKSTASPRPGKPFDTQYTGKKGLAHFNGLKPDGTYCWVAIISPSFQASQCASWQFWQTGDITLGT